jgi:hypothetical protein
MGRNFLSNAKLVKVKDHSAASTDEITSDIIDTAGFQGAVFFTSFGTANATNSIKVQQNTANQTTGMADLTGTSVASGTSPSNEDVIVEVHQPQERYLQLVVTRGASSTCESIWACLYGNADQVSSNSVSGTQVAELHVAPDEGTA